MCHKFYIASKSGYEFGGGRHERENETYMRNKSAARAENLQMTWDELHRHTQYTAAWDENETWREE